MSVKSEALRYLGYGRNTPDDKTAALLDKAADELTKTAAPKYCYKAVGIGEAEALLLGDDIKKHVEGCERVILFAATLGAPADALIRRAEISDMAYAVILDAAASAYIEEVCDNAEEEMRLALGISAGQCTWRFSPGYGDYPITAQRGFIRFIEADKRIGLTASESSTLIPRKSVTAVIGVRENISDNAPKKRGCDTCPMRENCKFKKENKSCGQDK